MSNESKTADTFQQMSLFDLMEMSASECGKMSSDDLGNLINKLLKARATARQREDKERRRKEWEEKERKDREERKRTQAHIQKVTCMDLPRDWENVLNSDEWTQGVHTDSIPDALIMSLTPLGKVDKEADKEYKGYPLQPHLSGRGGHDGVGGLAQGAQAVENGLAEPVKTIQFEAAQ